MGFISGFKGLNIKVEQNIIKNVCMSLRKVPVFSCYILMKLEFS